MKNTISALSLCALFSLPGLAFGADNSLVGKWDLYIPTPNGENIVLAEITDQNGKLSGVLNGKRGKAPMKNLQTTENNFTFEQQMEKLFVTVSIEFKGSVVGDEINGEVETPGGPMPFRGIRK